MFHRLSYEVSLRLVNMVPMGAAGQDSLKPRVGDDGLCGSFSVRKFDFCHRFLLSRFLKYLCVWFLSFILAVSRIPVNSREMQKIEGENSPPPLFFT